MAYEKTIICLAKSAKHKGYCIAGKELVKGKAAGWIRVVSDHQHEEIAANECLYESRREAKLLDIITIPMLAARPHSHQVENHLIVPEQFWTKEGEFDSCSLQSCIDTTDGPLWINGDSSTYGLNDRIPESEVEGIQHSLMLIQPKDLTICVETEGARFGNPKKRMRAEFRFADEEYKLGVTDPAMRDKYWSRLGEHKLGDGSFLCVSLGEIYYNHAYKIVAAVITPIKSKSK